MSGEHQKVGVRPLGDEIREGEDVKVREMAKKNRAPADPHDLDDVMAEEMSRGKRHPIKALTRERTRAIRHLADMLADPMCDERAFLAAIRAYGLQEGSEEFSRSWKLWRQRHGST